MIFRSRKDSSHVESEEKNRIRTYSEPYQKLEKRRVLNATFAFDVAAAQLTLADFIDSTGDANSVDVSQSGDDFIIDLNDGFWTSAGNVSDLNFQLSNGDSRLTILDANFALSSIRFNANTADVFDVQIDRLDFSNGDLLISGSTGSFGSVSETNSGSFLNVDVLVVAADSIDFGSGNHDANSIAFDTTADQSFHDVDDLTLTILRSASGNIDVSAKSSIDSFEFGPGIRSLSGDISIETTSFDADLFINNDIVSDHGSVNLWSANRLIVSENVDIFSETGDISFVSNINGGTEDGSIIFEIDTIVESISGNILLDSTGQTIGDIFVSEIITSSNAENAVVVLAGGSVFESAPDESINISALNGGLQITANGDVGTNALTGLRTNTSIIAFDVSGQFFLTNFDRDLKIASLGSLNASSLGAGGRLATLGALTIDTTIDMSASFEFSTERSDSVGDDIIFGSSGQLNLDSTLDSIITVAASDDIVFDGGQITTNGSQGHELRLLAGRESLQDGNAGQIVSRVEQSLTQITTNNLFMIARGGVGDSNEGLSRGPIQIQADTLNIINEESGGVSVNELDEINVLEIRNVNRSIEFIAGGDIFDIESPVDNFDFIGGDVTIQSTNGSIGRQSGDLFKGIFDSVEVIASDKLTVVANFGSVILGGLDEVTTLDVIANTLILASDNDLDATVLDATNSTITNLGLIADADRDSTGNLILAEHVEVEGDLRLQGQSILAFNSASETATPELVANRLLVETNAVTEFDTSVQQIDLAIGNDADVRIANDRSLTFVDLDCLRFGEFVGVWIQGSLSLSIDGDLSQNTSIFVTGSTTIDATGKVCLTGLKGDEALPLENNFDGLLSGSAETFEVVDVDSLTVGEIVASERISLQSGALISSDLSLAGNLLTGNSDGIVRLVSSGDIDQIDGSIISHQLMLSGKNLILSGPNSVDNLSAFATNDFQFSNQIDLNIANTIYNSTCVGPEFADGVQVDGNLILNVDGNLSQSVSVMVGGNSILEATGSICLSGSDCTTDGTNENDFIGQVTAFASAIEIRDSNDLYVGELTSETQIFVAAGDGGNGNLFLSGDITTVSETGEVIIRSTNNIDQLNGKIHSDILLIDGTASVGNFNLVLENRVNTITGHHLGTLVFNNGIDLEVGQSNFSSTCDSSFAFCGLTIAGNLELAVGGDLSQSATVVVVGDTRLMATESICLNGGSCDDERSNQNDFGGSIIATAATIELADINSIYVTELNSQNDIFLNAEGGSLFLLGDLKATSVDAQVFLTATESIRQLSGSISTSDLILSGGGTEQTFELLGENQISNLAAMVYGNLNVRSQIDLNIAEIIYESSCGTAAQFDGIDVVGDATFDVAGNLAQTASINISGLTFIDASGDICFIGNCENDPGLETIGNDFGTVQIANGQSVEIADSNELSVLGIDATNQIRLVTGTSDSIAGDGLAGRLNINGDLSANRIFIQSTEGAIQSSGVINAETLIIADLVRGQGGGPFEFSGANRISQITGEIDSNLILNSLESLTVLQLTTFESTCCFDTFQFEGLIAEQANLTVDLDLSFNGVTQTQSLFVIAGGDVRQTIPGTISSDQFGLIANGNVYLNSENLIATMAGQTGGFSVINNSKNLTIGSVAIFAETPFQMSATGFVVEGLESKFTIDGDLHIQNAISAEDSNLFLSTSGDLIQSNDGTISSKLLGMQVAGRTDLRAQNLVSVLAANNSGSIVFNNVDELTIGSVTVFEDQVFEMSAVGVESTTDVKITNSGDLQIDEQIETGSSLFLMVGGDVRQNSAGKILATNFGIGTSGQVILDQSNDVEIAAIAADRLVIFNDSNDLTIGSVVVFVGSNDEMSITGFSSESDIKISTGGSLLVDSPINSQRNLFLSVQGELSQSDEGIVRSEGLGIMVDGSTSLSALNAIQQFSAETSGSVILNNVGHLSISTVTVATDSDFEMSSTGISTNANDAKVTTSGNILIDAPIQTGVGNTLLSAGGNLTQTIFNPAGQDSTIRTNRLGLMVAGETILNNEQNAFNVLAVDSGLSSIRVNSDLTIGSITVAEMNLTGVTVDGDFSLNVLGSIDQTAAIYVEGSTELWALNSICLSGSDCDQVGNDGNNFVGSVFVAAGDELVLWDANQLTIRQATAGNQIWLRAGNRVSGNLVLSGDVQTLADDGKTLLQASDGLTQLPTLSSIETEYLMIGSQIEREFGAGDFFLNGPNRVGKISAAVNGHLEFSNIGTIEITASELTTSCTNTTEQFLGLDVYSVVVNVIPNDGNGDLIDSFNATTRIRTTADFNVNGTINLGDEDAVLVFVDHSVNQLTSQLSSEVFLTVSAIGNKGNFGVSDIGPANEVFLFVDSSIIFSDTRVENRLFVDTLETETGQHGSAGDVLQTMVNDFDDSKIQAVSAAFISRASVQLTNTFFESLALQSNFSASPLILPFSLNGNIGSTFTGSLDANVFTDENADPFLLNGTNDVNGVFNVEDSFLADGFFRDNNQFVNPTNVGSIVINQKSLNIQSFDSLNLEPEMTLDVISPDVAARSMGDLYLETENSGQLNILADLIVNNSNSNITVIASSDLILAEGVKLTRTDLGDVLGVVNTKQGLFATDPFVLSNPRSVIEAPGDSAFSDLNAQLDSAIGYQPFEFFFGNVGETSFNLITGWFVDFVTPSQAIDPAFQARLLQANSQTTSDFLLHDFDNFGQRISAHSIRMSSFTEGSDSPILLSNITPFQQSFFGDRSFLLSQMFVINDARINLFENGGETDLNFTQEILPTRTVVQNPDIIVVATPSFFVPDSPISAPAVSHAFVNFIQQPSSDPISTEAQPESFFVIKFTEDDDGIFDLEFQWSDPDDDPDAIRNAIENADPYQSQTYWQENNSEEELNWTEKIKDKQRVRPGLYFIFEVQEGQELPDPVDTPVDRTDLENLIEDENDLESDAAPPNSNSPIDDAVTSLAPTNSNIDETLVSEVSRESLADNSFYDQSHQTFSNATQNSMLGSSLMMASLILRNNLRKDTSLCRTPELSTALEAKRLFSPASRIFRKSIKPK